MEVSLGGYRYTPAEIAQSRARLIPEDGKKHDAESDSDCGPEGQESPCPHDDFPSRKIGNTVTLFTCNDCGSREFVTNENYIENLVERLTAHEEHFSGSSLDVRGWHEH